MELDGVKSLKLALRPEDTFYERLGTNGISNSWLWMKFILQKRFTFSIKLNSSFCISTLCLSLKNESIPWLEQDNTYRTFFWKHDTISIFLCVNWKKYSWTKIFKAYNFTEKINLKIVNQKLKHKYHYLWEMAVYLK